MGYHMEYGTGREDAYFRKTGNIKHRVAVSSIIISSLLVIGFVFRGELVDVLLPGDPAATRKAIDTLVEELRAGETAVDAFAEFCKVILHEAHIS